MVTENEVIEELKKIIDPHTDINIYEMGLIKDIKVKGNDVSLTFIPSSPYCPLGIQLAIEIKRVVKEIKGIGEVDVKVEGHEQQEEINRMLKEK